MKQRFAILIGGLLLALLVVGPMVQAQPSRVGVLLRVDSPEFVSDLDIAAATLRQIKENLHDVRGIVLVDQEKLVSAQKRLGINIRRGSALRDLHALATLLELDRLVIVDVTVSNRFRVSLEATVITPRIDPIFVASFTVVGPNLNNVLGRAVKELLHQLLPALI